jgi:hypothetical protein
MSQREPEMLVRSGRATRICWPRFRYPELSAVNTSSGAAIVIELEVECEDTERIAFRFNDYSNAADIRSAGSGIQC